MTGRLKRSWRSRSAIALLIAALPLIFLGMNLTNDLFFLLKSKSSVGAVVNTQTTKTRVWSRGSLEGGDSYPDVWVPSVSLVIRRSDGVDEMQCTVAGDRDVFGEAVGGEREVRQKLAELAREQSVLVKYYVHGDAIECRLHVVWGTRWIPFVIFLMLTVIFFMSFLMDLRTSKSTLSEERLP